MKSQRVDHLMSRFYNRNTFMLTSYVNTSTHLFEPHRVAVGNLHILLLLRLEAEWFGVRIAVKLVGAYVLNRTRQHLCFRGCVRIVVDRTTHRHFDYTRRIAHVERVGRRFRLVKLDDQIDVIENVVGVLFVRPWLQMQEKTF